MSKKFIAKSCIAFIVLNNSCDLKLEKNRDFFNHFLRKHICVLMWFLSPMRIIFDLHSY